MINCLKNSPYLGESFFIYYLFNVLYLGGEFIELLNYYSSKYNLFCSVSSMIGPAISSFLYDYYGYHIFIFFNMLLIVIALCSEMGIRNLDGKNTQITVKNQQANLQGSESIWVLMRNRDIRNAII